MNRRTAVATGAAAASVAALASLRWCDSEIPVQSPVLSGARARREVKLIARAAQVDLGLGQRPQAWTYDARLPGTELRFKEGEHVLIVLENRLPAPTSIHWHGLPQRGTNAMDGVPGVTQKAVAPGDSFVYEFVAEPAGTFFFHSHFGLQLEHGLYAPLIIEPARESLSYDREYVVVLDDWPARSPEAMMAELLSGEAMGKMAGMMRGPMEGARAPVQAEENEVPLLSTAGTSAPAVSFVTPPGTRVEAEPDIAYSSFLINGRLPSSVPPFIVRRGDLVRFRIINAGASTAFRIAAGGHRMQVTHTDGFPCVPVEVDTLEISVGERYDVMIRMNNPGVWPLVAMSVDEPGRGARADISYLDAGASAIPPANAVPRELAGRILTYGDLIATEERRWVTGPHRLLDTPLGGQMMPYEWTIGNIMPRGAPVQAYAVRSGETVHVRMRNDSPMRHPMHLHGHSFRLLTRAGGRTVWKDTVTVNPGATVNFQFTADNPGDWLYHCHHAYHQEAGMMRVVRYVT